MNPENTMLEVRCWYCQQALVRFHNVFSLIDNWQQVTAMLPVPLPPGCYSCHYQHLGIILTEDVAPYKYPKDWEGFRLNDLYPPKETH